MYGGGQFFPAVMPGFGTTAPSTTPGITVEQYAAIEMMKVIMQDVNCTPMTYDEMAVKAKRAALAIVHAI